MQRRLVGGGRGVAGGRGRIDDDIRSMISTLPNRLSRRRAKESSRTSRRCRLVRARTRPVTVFETPVAPLAAVPEPEPAYSSPTPVSSILPAEPQAFVTETMAELYLQQGHLEPALEIYQRLVEQ